MWSRQEGEGPTEMAGEVVWVRLCRPLSPCSSLWILVVGLAVGLQAFLGWQTSPSGV